MSLLVPFFCPGDLGPPLLAADGLFALRPVFHTGRCHEERLPGIRIAGKQPVESSKRLLVFSGCFLEAAILGYMNPLVLRLSFVGPSRCKKGCKRPASNVACVEEGRPG